MPASGFGGSGPHYGHTPSCHRYVGVVLVGAVLAGFLESAPFVAGSEESAFFMAGFWESAFFMVGFWESVLLEPASWSRPSRSYLGEGFWE